MKKPKISIAHCVWRDGRPRFVPGPGLRRLGFRGQDLKHPDGRWFSVEETQVHSEDIQRQAAEARQKAPAKPVRPPRRVAGVPTLADIVAAWFASPRMQGRTVTTGKRTQRALAPATVEHYRQMARIFQEDHPDVWASPAAAISSVVAYRLYERLYEKRDLAMARAIMITLGAAWKHGGKTGKVDKDKNPFHRLDMETPEPRIRVGTIAEMQQLITAADLIGLPEIGDAVMMGLATAQRKADRLRLEDGSLIDGELHFRQSKRGAVVIVPRIPQLVARLDAARERRKDWRVNYPHIILDEDRRRPFDETNRWDRYNKRFGKVRRAAVDGVGLQGATGFLPPMPSLADFRDQDLRDTAVTWLANAGCTVPEISSITGHSEESVHKILKHYLGQDPDRARSAIGKLVKWLDEKRANL